MASAVSLCDWRDTCRSVANLEGCRRLEEVNRKRELDAKMQAKRLEISIAQRVERGKPFGHLAKNCGPAPPLVAA